MAVNYGQVAIVPKGAWNAETQYKVNNLVSYDGSSYVAKVQPPVGTLPTDTSYWQVSAAGTKKATADSLGTVMPDGTTTSVGEDGKLSVNTAQQDALGVVKGSDDITVGEDGTLTVNTTFEQATELANIIAGEAIKSVLGKVSKAIATTMSLDENALLKNMISGIDVNDSNKVPSSAYIHTLVERIGMGTELVSGLGDLTTGLNTVNNNLESGYLKIKVYGSCIRLVQKTVSFTNGIGYIPLSEIFESFNPKYAIGVSQPIDLESEGIALVSVSKDGNNMKIALNKSYTGTKWVSFIAIGSL